MYKQFLAATVLMFAASSQAAVDCSGVPEVVKMGNYASQERYVIVTINGQDYRLGDGADDYTKARMTLVQTALLAGKKIKLRFYGHSSCSAAGSDRAIPSSTQMTR